MSGNPLIAVISLPRSDPAPDDPDCAIALQASLRIGLREIRVLRHNAAEKENEKRIKHVSKKLIY